MLSSLAKLLKALNSETAPWQIALALCLALPVALTPFWGLHNLLILLVALLIRCNFSSFLVGLALFSLLAMVVDPLSVRLGESLLANPALIDTWTSLYQNDFWRLMGFNHTLTLGGFVIAMVAFAPLFVVLRVLINQYRHRVMVWVNKLKVVQVLKASKFYNLYQSLAG
ncbi:TIGR03546 family protein [Oceanobacter mangrovi]|uniref:TIGR03546 family protein n=1 Tax=Oceanobacter mangrovi TaxID=2862510 RepID=UPI001C8D7AAF|nr:TIGR03546 family protein [Oceanobacter mangrovi]